MAQRKSRRERILELVERGHSYRGIAGRLKVSLSTVYRDLSLKGRAPKNGNSRSVTRKEAFEATINSLEATRVRAQAEIDALSDTIRTLRQEMERSGD